MVGVTRRQVNEGRGVGEISEGGCRKIAITLIDRMGSIARTKRKPQMRWKGRRPLSCSFGLFQ